jgi:PRTRC genetic system ThiF family protein
MQLLTIDPAVPFGIGATEFHITVVGAGGTGSYVVQGLARLMAHCTAIGGPLISATILDGDVVEEKNVGRQLFSRAEVGRNKAQTLVARFNAAFGLQMEALPIMATDAVLQNQGTAIRNRLRRDVSYNVLVGAVDGHEGRIAMAKALKSWKYDMWIDAGNHEHAGQVVLGTKSSRKDLRGVFALGSFCSALPSPAMMYPRLLRATAERPRQDCAAAVEDNRQSLMINEQIATIVGQYLTQIVIRRQLTTFETEIDLQAFSMRSTPITAANVAKAAKMTVDELTQPKPVERKAA